MIFISNIDIHSDGISHVRIDPHGKTLLGRLLCNTAHTPFKIPDVGKFESLEAFWLWNCSGRKKEYFTTLSKLYGPAANHYRDRLLRIERTTFRKEILEALECKIRQTPRLMSLLEMNNARRCPLHRYEISQDGDNVSHAYDDNKWFMVGIETIRRKLFRHKTQIEKTTHIESPSLALV